MKFYAVEFSDNKTESILKFLKKVERYVLHAFKFQICWIFQLLNQPRMIYLKELKSLILNIHHEMEYELQSMIIFKEMLSNIILPLNLHISFSFSQPLDSRSSWVCIILTHFTLTMNITACSWDWDFWVPLQRWVAECLRREKDGKEVSSSGGVINVVIFSLRIYQ